MESRVAILEELCSLSTKYVVVIDLVVLQYCIHNYTYLQLSSSKKEFNQTLHCGGFENSGDFPELAESIAYLAYM